MKTLLTILFLLCISCEKYEEFEWKCTTTIVAKYSCYADTTIIVSYHTMTEAETEAYQRYGTSDGTQTRNNISIQVTSFCNCDKLVCQ